MSTKRYQIAWFFSVLIIIALMCASFSSSSHTLVNAAGAGSVPTGLADYERWVGSQHAHVNMDGDDGYTGSTAAQAFTYAKNLPHLDYYIVTPHLHQNRSGDATLWYESTYDAIRASAASATTADFVALAGMEVSTISTGGHWNLYNANDLVGQDHADGDWNDADDYYDHVVGLAAAGEQIAVQFNHPNIGDFGNRYDANAAPYVGTIAVSSGPAYSTATDFSDSGGNKEAQWEYYLGLGWKLAPSADQDNHENTWGASSSEYTVIVRAKGTTLNQTNVIQGLREHMTYATEDANMEIGFIANGWSMGQTIGGSSNVAFTIWWNNPSAVICNNNVPVCRTEQANDTIQNIWIYENSFSTVAANYQPNTTGGTWNITLPATVGDWFVVKFQDSSTLSSGRSATKDYTWSAPVWYDPAHTDVPVPGPGDPSTPTPTTTNTPTSTATDTPTPIATDTPTPTTTNTPTSTATDTPTPTATDSITSSATPTPTATTTPTATATPTAPATNNFRQYLPIVIKNVER
jgi:hypothetical protein